MGGEASLNCEGRKLFVLLQSSPSLHSGVSSVLAPSQRLVRPRVEISKCPDRRSSDPSQLLLLSLLPLCDAVGAGEKRWSNCGERITVSSLFCLEIYNIFFFLDFRADTVKIWVGASMIRNLIKMES